MVAIKDIEMPKCCVTYTSENDNYTGCPFYKICEQRETIKTNYKPSDCPLVEIEERKVGKWVYKKLGVRTYGLVCSCCNYIMCEGQNYDSLEEFKAWVNKRLIEPNIELDYFCHKCGADMRGSKDE